MTNYRKMMFLSIWNRTNLYVTGRGSTSNLDALRGFISIKMLKTYSLTPPPEYSVGHFGGNEKELEGNVRGRGRKWEEKKQKTEG